MSSVDPLATQGSNSFSRFAAAASNVPPHSSMRLNSCFSLNKIQSVFSTFGPDKKEIVSSIGFGGLFNVPKQTTISRQLAFWLLRSMDYTSGSLVLRNGVRLKICDVDVHLVLGLLYEDVRDVRLGMGHAGDIVRGVLKLGSNMEIGLDYLEDLLTREYGYKMSRKDKDAFKVAIVVFVEAYFLAPKGSVAKVNSSLFHYVVDPDAIQHINWAAYVLRNINEASRRVQQAVGNKKKCVTLDCCLLFLEVFYLDNLDMGALNSDYKVLPRVSEYPAERLKLLINEDRDAAIDETIQMFGKLKIRPNVEVIYSRGSTVPSRRGQSNVTMMKDAECIQRLLKNLKEELKEHAVVYVENVESTVEKFERSLVDVIGGGACVEKFSPCIAGSPVSLSNKFNEKSDIVVDVECMTPASHDVTNTGRASGEYMTICSPSSSVSVLSIARGAVSSGTAGAFSSGPAFDQSGTRGGICDMSACSFRFGPEDNAGKDHGDVMERNFPPSPFKQLVEDPVAPKIRVLTLIKTIPYLDVEDKKRFWFIHDTPSTISLSGEVLQGHFTGLTDLCGLATDGLFRLNNWLDGQMYGSKNEIRWRHFLPPSFAETVMQKPAILWAEITRVMFSGLHIPYDVGACRMVIAPVMVEWNWSCYIWDF